MTSAAKVAVSVAGHFAHASAKGGQLSWSPNSPPEPVIGMVMMKTMMMAIGAAACAPGGEDDDRGAECLSSFAQHNL
jgi:hypothetical protein